MDEECRPPLIWLFLSVPDVQGRLGLQTRGPARGNAHAAIAAGKGQLHCAWLASEKLQCGGSMPLRRGLLPVLLLPFLFFVAVSAAQNVQGACTEIVLSPYSAFTYGINNAGDVVGYYQNESDGYDGYLRTADGNETIIDYPGFAGATQAYGINDKGQVVGTAGAQVFLYDIASQTFSDVDLQGLSNAGLVAINNAGAIVGTTTVNDTSYGYIAKSGHVTLLLPPGAASASAYGVSRNGTVIGSATLKNGSNIYYSYLKGKYSRIRNVPGLTAISPSASYFVGNKVNKYGEYVGFMRHGKSGFNFECGETVGLGVNDSGQAVGYYGFIGDPFVDGFIWSPTVPGR